MTIRERLFDLLNETTGMSTASKVDHLLDNSVTFAKDNNVPSKWIPVTERLPDNADKVLALSKASFAHKYLCWLIRYNHKKCGFYDYDSEWGDIKIHNVTHWMPLPEPPKENDQ